ncbi:hypothetical protein A8C32_09265 [Flavivirga aquatica]|uniref:Uncharacterized protein n=1 Tax=Flavivirga aquatica TaxID=1849968 RepID=A0A1E5SJQ1_9FLAO|nr:hypothetical protein [Flavivirga aquatica]OEJ99342.1 hypothetical protein A8C32_09265 [Flavivirga aquatica]
MGAIELRNTILNKLNAIEDSSMLQGVLRYIEEHSSKDEIVAYTVQGEPLTKKKYIQKVKDAEKGNFISSEELKKRMQSW